MDLFLKAQVRLTNFIVFQQFLTLPFPHYPAILEHVGFPDPFDPTMVTISPFEAWRLKEMS